MYTAVFGTEVNIVLQQYAWSCMYTAVFSTHSTTAVCSKNMCTSNPSIRSARSDGHEMCVSHMMLNRISRDLTDS